MNTATWNNMARVFYGVVGLVLICSAYCGHLLFPLSIESNQALVISYRLHHFHDWPAWLVIGALLGSSHLLITCLWPSLRQAFAESTILKKPFPLVSFCLVTLGFMATGEALLQMAVLYGW